MFCPKCKYEYRSDRVECPDCGARLVKELPLEAAKKAEPVLELVTILETGDQFLVARAKSILDDADIRYLVKGEGLQDLFGLGRIGLGYNQVVGPVQLQVRKDEERLARSLIEGIDDDSSEDAEE